MATTDADAVPAGKPPRFYQVAEVAGMFGVSKMTIYRAINDDQFPAIRIRGRFAVPAQVIDDMVAAAVSGNGTVDVASWGCDVA